jgi:hypothetical protein
MGRRPSDTTLDAAECKNHARDRWENGRAPNRPRAVADARARDAQKSLYVANTNVIFCSFPKADAPRGWKRLQSRQSYRRR